MPPPKAPAFAEAAARETIELLKRSRGRAFVLFTSYAVLRAVQPFVEMALSYPILVQGTAPRSTLIAQFRSTPNAVLLATSSFWQGVDVVGEALSCVIIDKLPFASPGDPVVAARIDAITAAGPRPADQASRRSGRPGHPGSAAPDDGIRPAFSGVPAPCPGHARPRCGRAILQVNCWKVIG
jgi:Rad3-related DNA helicase